MRKILLVAVVLLVAPAVAPAGDEPRRTKQAEANAAWSCRAERQVLGDNAFAKRYGTRKVRAAQVKCISIRATQQLSSRAAPLFERTTGTINTTASSNSLTLGMTGSATGRPLGGAASSSAITVDLSQSTRNKLGGFCAPGAGSTTLADSTSALTLTVLGTYCTVGSGAGAGQAFAGTYTVSGGEGAFAESDGHGIVILAVAGGGSQARLLETGSLTR